MKKVIATLSACLATLILFAQTSKPAAKPSTTKPTQAKTAAAAPVMKSQLDSFSYALGVSIATFYKSQGVSNINNAMVMKAFNDMKNGHPAMNETQTNTVLMNYMQKIRSNSAAGTRREGESFLVENSKKPGIVTLPSGLQYQVLKEGTGPKPTINDQVKVHYTGSLVNGQVFESSLDRGEPLTIGVGSVIKGWTEALQLMPVGSKWKLFIPSDLAYGDNQAGPQIKPGSTLIFEVELLDIVKQ